MPDDPTVELVLEVPRHGEPIRGRVRGTGDDRPFSGWMEFSYALEGLGAWTAATVRFTLEPASDRATDEAKADEADTVAGWLSLAAALQALSYVRSRGGSPASGR